MRHTTTALTGSGYHVYEMVYDPANACAVTRNGDIPDFSTHSFLRMLHFKT